MLIRAHGGGSPMMALKTRRWDAAEALKTKSDVAAYLHAARKDGDPALLKAAHGDVARAATRRPKATMCFSPIDLRIRWLRRI